MAFLITKTSFIEWITQNDFQHPYYIKYLQTRLEKSGKNSSNFKHVILNIRKELSKYSIDSRKSKTEMGLLKGWPKFRKEWAKVESTIKCHYEKAENFSEGWSKVQLMCDTFYLMWHFFKKIKF
jgi:hypothetical protein